jgi:hypothetical protein
MQHAHGKELELICRKKAQRDGTATGNELPQKNTARAAATKTVPRERLAPRRRGAEKDQEETPCLVFSVSLRLGAKKDLNSKQRKRRRNRENFWWIM